MGNVTATCATDPLALIALLLDYTLIACLAPSSQNHHPIGPISVLAFRQCQCAILLIKGQ